MVLNAIASVVLAPIAAMPGWLSNTIISAVMGVALILIFKYTSNQKARGRIWDDIKAGLLALRLYKDEFSVTMRSQGKVFGGAFRLLFNSIRPLAVIILPVILVLAQMALWYQFRPLRVGEEATVTMKLNGTVDNAWPSVQMEASTAAEVALGPVQVYSDRRLEWIVRAVNDGSHKLSFLVDGKKVEKELAIGDGFMRLSPLRPGWKWSDVLLYPQEKPFKKNDVVHSISVTYPNRESWTSGTNWWMLYFFVVSMLFALAFKPVFKVKL